MESLPLEGLAPRKKKIKTEDTAESKLKNSGARKALGSNSGLSRTPLPRTPACHCVSVPCPRLPCPLPEARACHFISVPCPRLPCPLAEARTLQAWAANLSSPPLPTAWPHSAPGNRQEDSGARLGGLLVIVYLGWTVLMLPHHNLYFTPPALLRRGGGRKKKKINQNDI